MLGTSQVKPDNYFFELFITTAPIPDLNEKITVFGRVIKGEDIVQVRKTFLTFALWHCNVIIRSSLIKYYWLLDFCRQLMER